MRRNDFTDGDKQAKERAERGGEYEAVERTRTESAGSQIERFYDVDRIRISSTDLLSLQVVA